MRIVFVSNYFNHHQEPLARALCNTEDVEFFFIETEPMEEERKQLGWQEVNKNKNTFIYSAYNKKEYRECQKTINEADVVIWGSAPKKMIKKHLKKRKPTFFYTERLYKNIYPKSKILFRKVKMYFDFGRYSSMYVLAASAFAPLDFAMTKTLVGKMYKWGYFPEAKKYEDICGLIEGKRNNSILWVARFTDWKHPEKVIELAKRLKNSNCVFSINMIGSGDMLDEINQKIIDEDLLDHVHILGTMSPEKVREEMEKSKIFLLTSDRNEGWGAVLNESMNSGCAVVASHSIGAVPFLIKDKENGLIYINDDMDDLTDKVKWLLENEKESQRIGEKAYNTIVNQWNAETAADRLVGLIEEIKKGTKNLDVFDEGICSPAQILNDDWYLC